MRLCKQLFILLLLIALAFVLLTSWEGYNMASGMPDWARGMTLIGQDPDGNLVLVQVDADGQLTVPFKGVNPDENLVTVAVDADGQLYAILRGASGEDLLIDSDGFLSAILKGEKPDTSLSNVAVDDDGQIISIMKGASGYSLAVDSDGFMTAVLKGLYGAELRTIGLDDDGRISGYLVDDEDQWGQILKVGNAEQAARLGSPVSWDRRGQVLNVFDFSDGLHGFRQVLDGEDAAIALDSTYWQTGGYSVKLTGGKDDNLWAWIATYTGFPPSEVFGAAIRWTSEPTPAYLRIKLGGVKDHTSHVAEVRYDFTNEKLEYKNTGAQWTEIGSQKIEEANYIFHYLKVVVDFDNDVFVRAMLDNIQYDMTAAILTSAVPTQGDYAKIEIYCVSNSGDNDVIYIDSVILTTKEPT